MTYSYRPKYISFCNLDSRPDRLEHMTKELERVGLKAVRQRALPWKETDYQNPKYSVMYNRTPGAIGCLLSQVEVIKKAYDLGLYAVVLEDDLVFATDFNIRMEYIENWLFNISYNHDWVSTPEGPWDIFFLGGTFHSPAFWHPKGPSGMRPDVSAHLGKDFDHTSDPRIKRTYGAFSTHAYIVNYHSIPKILSLIDKHVHESIGIDHLFIRVQPQLNCFAFVPGCVKQIDNISDIGSGMTMFSGFSKLNGTIENSRYWFQDLMTDFNPDTFEWK